MDFPSPSTPPPAVSPATPPVPPLAVPPGRFPRFPAAPKVPAPDPGLGLRRRKRKLFAGAIYLLLFAFLGWVIYLIARPDPTCFDGKQNQNEEGVDCGGVCGACAAILPDLENMEIQESAIVYGGPGRYDVLAKLYNPNFEYGARSFAYTFAIKDENGQVLAERQGYGFILPRETKYVIETQLASEALPKKISFEIRDVQWQKLEDYKEKPTLSIRNQQYNQVSSGPFFSEAKGLLINESPYDFESVIIKVVLRDAENKPIALNSTEMRTIVSGERRDFRLVWPTAFPSEYASMEAEAEADVYHSENFTRQYLPGARF